jgi:hypothetical protein
VCRICRVEEIDTINIYWAGLLAMRRAVEGLRLAPQPLDRRTTRDPDDQSTHAHFLLSAADSFLPSIVR